MDKEFEEFDDLVDASDEEVEEEGVGKPPRLWLLLAEEKDDHKEEDEEDEDDDSAEGKWKPAFWSREPMMFLMVLLLLVLTVVLNALTLSECLLHRTV